MLEEKLKEWKRTRSLTLAAEICDQLAPRTISDDLVKQVIDWGRDKGITNPDKQLCKVLEEVGEMAHEICRSQYTSEEMQDSIGDSLITIIILADILNFDPLFCLQEAYNTIKDRKGKTRNGCFEKEEDIK